MTYSLRDDLAENQSGFQPDGITNGRILILVGAENGPGGAEVKFRDASGEFISATADGAKVVFLGLDEATRVARVDANYELSGVTENYLLKFGPSGGITLLLNTVRTRGITPKVSILRGVCEAY